MQRAAPLQIVSEYKHCLLDLKVYATNCAMGCAGDGVGSYSVADHAIGYSGV